MTDSETRKQLASGLKATWVGLIANVFLIAVKLWGGIAGRSQALIADAIDSISDVIGNVVVLFGLKMGRKEPDEDHHYGHARIETIASLVIGFLLLAAGFAVAYNSINSIYYKKVDHPSLLAIYSAVVSILIKEALYWYTKIVGKRIKSIALIGHAWNYRFDALTTITVLIGVGVAYVKPEWALADAYAALLVSFFIFKVGGGIMGNAFKELVDTAPERPILDEMAELARNTPGVMGVHDLKARRSGPNIFVDLHVEIDPHITVEDGHAIAEEVERRLLEEVQDVARVTIHVDPHFRSE